jgi:hypothetical protein
VSNTIKWYQQAHEKNTAQGDGTMFEDLTTEEYFALGFAIVVMLAGLYRIFTSGRHSSNFFNWLLVIFTGACVYLWRSGIALEAYTYIKTVLITPY